MKKKKKSFPEAGRQKIDFFEKCKDFLTGGEGKTFLLEQGEAERDETEKLLWIGLRLPEWCFEGGGYRKSKFIPWQHEKQQKQEKNNNNNFFIFISYSIMVADDVPPPDQFKR